MLINSSDINSGNAHHRGPAKVARKVSGSFRDFNFAISGQLWDFLTWTLISNNLWGDYQNCNGNTENIFRNLSSIK